tara:strand:+ start:278 stop:433 length:156 start_codon:yes stop_codon:yes gene_type:complete
MTVLQLNFCILLIYCIYIADAKVKKNKKEGMWIEQAKEEIATKSQIALAVI